MLWCISRKKKTSHSLPFFTQKRKRIDRKKVVILLTNLQLYIGPNNLFNVFLCHLMKWTVPGLVFKSPTNGHIYDIIGKRDIRQMSFVSKVLS